MADDGEAEEAGWSCRKIVVEGRGGRDYHCFVTRNDSKHHISRGPHCGLASIPCTSCNGLYQGLRHHVTRQQTTLAVCQEWTTLSSMLDPDQSPSGFIWVASRPDPLRLWIKSGHRFAAATACEGSWIQARCLCPQRPDT